MADKTIVCIHIFVTLKRGIAFGLEKEFEGLIPHYSKIQPIPEVGYIFHSNGDSTLVSKKDGRQATLVYEANNWGGEAAEKAVKLLKEDGWRVAIRN